MVVNLDQPFIDIDGNPTEHKMARLCRVVLLQGLQHWTPDEKLKAFDLAAKIHAGEELGPEDVVFLKATVGQVATPHEYGQLVAVLK